MEKNYDRKSSTLAKKEDGLMKKNINNYDAQVPAYVLMSWYDGQGNEIEFNPNNGMDKAEICKVTIWDIDGINYNITNKSTYQDVKKIEHILLDFAIENEFEIIELYKYLLYAFNLVLINNKEA